MADLEAIGPPFAQRGGDLLYPVEPPPFDVDTGHVYVVRYGVIVGSVRFQSILARGYVTPVEPTVDGGHDMDSDLVIRMYVQIANGDSKADSIVPLDAEADALWDRIAAEVADAKAAGFMLDVPNN